MSRAFLALTTALLLGGCQASASPAAIPTAGSSVVGSFVEQNDGLAGYSMLRPANWTSTSAGPSGRIYLVPGASPSQGIRLTVTNGRGCTWRRRPRSPSGHAWSPRPGLVVLRQMGLHVLPGGRQEATDLIGMRRVSFPNHDNARRVMTHTLTAHIRPSSGADVLDPIRYRSRRWSEAG